MWWSFALFVVRGRVSHLQFVWLPAWHTVYSSGKYEVSRGFLSVWFSLFARLFRPFSYLEARGSSYFPSEHTVYPPAFFSLCVRNSFLLRFFVRNSFFALSLRENCLVARCFRKLTYKVLVIQCIIIRRCIFGRFICICRLVCGVTEEWICC